MAVGKDSWTCGDSKECETCGRMFIPKYEWSKDCVSCFLSSEKGKAWKAQKDAESNKFDRGRRTKENNWHDYGEPPHQEQHGRYNQDFRNQFRPEQGATLTKELLRKLLQLCHPDKHGGSALANTVTQELLKMKEQLR